MNRIVIIMMSIIFITSLSYSDRYTNDEVGIAFNIPENVTLSTKLDKKFDHKNYKYFDGKYILSIYIKDLDNLPPNFFYCIIVDDEYEEVTDYKEMLIQAYKNNKPFHYDYDWNDWLNSLFIKDGKVIGEQRLLHLEVFGPDNLYYNSFSFIRDNYEVRLTLYYIDYSIRIGKNYPEFVIPINDERVDSKWKWKYDYTVDDIYKLLGCSSSDAPKEFLKMAEYMEEIKNSIEFIE